MENGVFSYLAPVSQKLMGARTGDRVTLTIDSHEYLFEVADFEPAIRRPTIPSN